MQNCSGVVIMNNGLQEFTELADEVFSKRQWNTVTSSSLNHHPTFENVVDATYDENIPSIHMLNNECLDHVLSCFNTIEHFKLALVCRRWYNLCITKISLITSLHCQDLWNKLSFRLNPLKMTLCQSNALSVISLNCGSLTYLSFGCYDVVIDETVFAVISKYCLNLLGLDTGRANIDQQISEQLSENFPKKLKYLGISVLENDEYLGNVLMKARFLEKLYLRCDRKSNLDGHGLCIAKYLLDNKMTSFNFSGFKKLKPAVLESILNNYHSTLEHLNISECGFDLLNFTINPSKKLYSMKRLFAAGTLDGGLSWDLSRRNLDDFGMGPLIFGYDYNLSFRELMSLFRLMPNLTVLDLTKNCDLRRDPLFIKDLAELCPLIESLNLSECHLVAPNLIYLENFKFLNKLGLDSVDRCDRLELSSRFDFEYLIEHIIGSLKELQCLSLALTDIDDDIAYLIVQNLYDNNKCFQLNIGWSINVCGTFVEKCQSINRSSIIEIFMTQTPKPDKSVKIPPFIKIKDDNDSFHYCSCDDIDTDPWLLKCKGNYMYF